MFNRLFLTLSFISLIAGTTHSSAFGLATWNAEQGSIESLARRSADLKRLGKALRAKNSGQLPEVLVLQEITSYASAVKIAKELGYRSGTVAVSDSGSDKKIWPFALEVAIVTNQAVQSVTSYQGRPNKKFSPFVVDLASEAITFGTVAKAQPPQTLGAAADEFIPRSILRVALAGGRIVYGVHLNSSGIGFCRTSDLYTGARKLKQTAEGLGLTQHAKAVEAALEAIKKSMSTARKPGIEATKQEVQRRARSREAAAGVLVSLAAQDAKTNTIYVAGDFNTPLDEPCKTGSDLKVDFEPLVGCDTGITPDTCGAIDGFDDTYAILTKDLLNMKLRFSVTTKDLKRTYVKPRFVDSPIDNILIAGPQAAKVRSVFRIEEPVHKGTVFGSDHYPVLMIH